MNESERASKWEIEKEDEVLLRRRLGYTLKQNAGEYGRQEDCRQASGERIDRGVAFGDKNLIWRQKTVLV